MPGRIRGEIQTRLAARLGGPDASSNGVAQPRQGLLGGGGPLRSMFSQVMDGTKNRKKSLDDPSSGARRLGLGEERMTRQEWEARERNQERTMSRSEWEQESRNRRDGPREMDRTERWVKTDHISPQRTLINLDRDNQRHIEHSERYMDQDQGQPGDWVDEGRNYGRESDQPQRWEGEDTRSESQYTGDGQNDQGTSWREMDEPPVSRDKGRRN